MKKTSPADVIKLGSVYEEGVLILLNFHDHLVVKIL